MTETAPVVLVDVDDRIATVTLNRPEARNALSRALSYALWDAVLAAGDDPDVDAVILTGADPAFSAGVDLKEVSGEIPPTADARGPGDGPERYGNGLYRFIPVIPKPVIGAINGVAVTGGLELALQCTFLVASERARFAHTHARAGIIPGGGVTRAARPGDRRAPGGGDVADRQLRVRRRSTAPRSGEPRHCPRGAAAFACARDRHREQRPGRGAPPLLEHYRRLPNGDPRRDPPHRGYMAPRCGATPTRSRRAATRSPSGGARRRRHEAEEPTRLPRQDSGRSEKMPGSPAWISIHSAPSSPARHEYNASGLKYPMPAPVRWLP